MPLYMTSATIYCSHMFIIAMFVVPRSSFLIINLYVNVPTYMYIHICVHNVATPKCQSIYMQYAYVPGSRLFAIVGVLLMVVLSSALVIVLVSVIGGRLEDVCWITLDCTGRPGSDGCMLITVVVVGVTIIIIMN